MYRERYQLDLLRDYFVIHTNIQSLCCTLEANIMLKSVKMLVAQSCSTLCNPTDCSPLSSSVHGILQARMLEWVAISYSREPSTPRDHTQGLNPGLLHCRQILYHLTTREAHTGVGCHFLLQGIVPTQGSNLRLLHLLHWQVNSPSQGSPRKPQSIIPQKKREADELQYSKVLCHWEERLWYRLTPFLVGGGKEHGLNPPERPLIPYTYSP